MHRTGATIIAALTIAWSATAGAAEIARPLSLKEALAVALEKNPKLLVERYNPAINTAELRKAEALYATHLTLDASLQYARSANPLNGNGTSATQVGVNPGIYRLLSSGGTLGFLFDNAYTSSDTSAPGVYWGSDLTVTLSQPLLKNFGRESTESSVGVALYARDGSLEHYQVTLFDLVAQVRTEYFKLFSLREDVSARTTSLELARKILSETQSRVKAGVLPAMEILNAEYGVATRERERIASERLLHDQEDLLRLLLSLPDKGEIIPTDPLPVTPLPVDTDRAVDLARTVRPEFAQLRSSIRSLELQQRVAESRTQPDLNLTAAAALTGAGTAYNRNLERLGSSSYPRWSVGVQFDYPLGNQSAEQDAVKSRLRVEQEKAQLKLLEETVRNEVSSTVRGVEVGFKQLDVADRGVSYAQERLKAFTKKYEVGLATTKDLLDVENDLASARSARILAQTNYAAAVTQYWRATGEILQRSGITLTADNAASPPQVK